MSRIVSSFDVKLWRPETPSRLHSYIVTLLQVRDQRHRNLSGLVALGRPVTLFSGFQQLLDFELLGKRAGFGHNADGHRLGHIGKCLL